LISRWQQQLGHIFSGLLEKWWHAFRQIPSAKQHFFVVPIKLRYHLLGGKPEFERADNISRTRVYSSSRSLYALLNPFLKLVQSCRPVAQIPFCKDYKERILKIANT